MDRRKNEKNNKMILDKCVKITISSYNIKRINKLLGSDYKINDIIDFPIENLSKTDTNHIFEVQCDICEYHKKTSMRLYNASFNNGEVYTCKKCSDMKVKKTKVEKYGDKNYCNKDKILETKLKRYNDKNIQKILKKYIKTRKKFNIYLKIKARYENH